MSSHVHKPITADTVVLMSGKLLSLAAIAAITSAALLTPTTTTSGPAPQLVSATEAHTLMAPSTPTSRALPPVAAPVVSIPAKWKLTKTSQFNARTAGGGICSRWTMKKDKKKLIRSITYQCRQSGVPVVSTTLIVSKKKTKLSTARTVSMFDLGSAGMHTFLMTHNGTYDRWNPCATIPIKTNLNGVDPDELRVVQAAATTLRNASGLPLTVSGTSTFIPKDSTMTDPDASGAIDLAWADPGTGATQSDALRPDSSHLGTASPRLIGTYVSAPSNYRYRYDAGGVVVRKDLRATMPEYLRVQVYMHELSHVLGLGHYSTANSSQLMDATLHWGRPPVLGAGDAVGLAKLGTGGCITP